MAKKKGSLFGGSGPSSRPGGGGDSHDTRDAADDAAILATLQEINSKLSGGGEGAAGVASPQGVPPSPDLIAAEVLTRLRDAWQDLLPRELPAVAAPLATPPVSVPIPAAPAAPETPQPAEPAREPPERPPTPPAPPPARERPSAQQPEAFLPRLASELIANVRGLYQTIAQRLSGSPAATPSPATPTPAPERPETPSRSPAGQEVPRGPWRPTANLPRFTVPASQAVAAPPSVPPMAPLPQQGLAGGAFTPPDWPGQGQPAPQSAGPGQAVADFWRSVRQQASVPPVPPQFGEQMRQQADLFTPVLAGAGAGEGGVGFGRGEAGLLRELVEALNDNTEELRKARGEERHRTPEQTPPPAVVPGYRPPASAPATPAPSPSRAFPPARRGGSGPWNRAIDLTRGTDTQPPGGPPRP